MSGATIELWNADSDDEDQRDIEYPVAVERDEDTLLYHDPDVIPSTIGMDTVDIQTARDEGGRPCTKCYDVGLADYFGSGCV
jgi:hypothetical protein